MVRERADGDRRNRRPSRPVVAIRLPAGFVRARCLRALNSSASPKGCSTAMNGSCWCGRGEPPRLRRPGVWTTSHCSTRRHLSPEDAPAPTATSSSTRRRISRPCSSGWWPGVHRRAPSRCSAISPRRPGPGRTATGTRSGPTCPHLGPTTTTSSPSGTGAWARPGLRLAPAARGGSGCRTHHLHPGGTDRSPGPRGPVRRPARGRPRRGHPSVRRRSAGRARGARRPRGGAQAPVARDHSVGLLERDAMTRPVTIVPAPAAKGLEFDAVVVLEPAAIAGRTGAGRACSTSP